MSCYLMPACIYRCSTVLIYTHAVCAWREPILRSKHREIHVNILQHHAQINVNTAPLDLKASKRRQIMYSPVHSMHRTLLLEAKQKKELGLTKVAVYKAPDQTDYSERGTYDMSVDKEDLKKRLSPMQYDVTQEHGTERAFSGEYYKVKADGFYHCVVCDAVLFKSDTKYDSGSGWPSFYDLAEKGVVKLHRDSSHGTVRTECVCAKCGAHLGHVFSDGPDPTGKRYCINSASLKFHPKKKLDKSDL